MKTAAAVLMAILAAGSTGAVAADFKYIVPEQYLNAESSEADRLEGIWQMTDNGAVFAIRRMPSSAAAYELVMIDSPDWQIAPGTAFGTLHATGNANTFDASLLTDPADSHSRSRDVIFELSADRQRITFRPYRRNRTITFERWFRYLFRTTIKESNRPTGIDGALRLGSDKLITL